MLLHFDDPWIAAAACIVDNNIYIYIYIYCILIYLLLDCYIFIVFFIYFYLSIEYLFIANIYFR